MSDVRREDKAGCARHSLEIYFKHYFAVLLEKRKSFDVFFGGAGFYFSGLYIEV